MLRMRIALLLVVAVVSSASAQLFSGGGHGPQPSITLRYFDIRGLAEPIRLTLAALGLDYEEVKYQRCPTNSLGAKECPQGVIDWDVAKQEGIDSGLLPFGQVPSLTYKDQESGKTFEMAQSHAILRFLAKKHSFYGTSEEEEVL
jgi:glutathione S-transferase|eukprot:COSAG02_NODE_3352_length_6884_cov_9.048342_2_plen_145_part_00